MKTLLKESSMPRPAASRPLDVDRLYCQSVRERFSADYWRALRSAWRGVALAGHAAQPQRGH